MTTGGKNIQRTSFNTFESIKHTDEKGDFWYARELMKVLGYVEWRNFLQVIEKSQKSAQNSQISSVNHFVESIKMVGTGYDNSAIRKIKDYRLDRYACYLIAQNGDPSRKPKVAEAQTYFAIQTRRQELNDQVSADRQRLERRREFSESDKRLSEDIMETGVSAVGMVKIKESGNRTFFGGKSSKEMKQKLGTGSRPWANKASNVVLAGKTLANELTSASIRYNGVSGAQNIEETNNYNNQTVRNAIYESQGINPEDFPAEEDTERIQRRLNKQTKSQNYLTNHP